MRSTFFFRFGDFFGTVFEPMQSVAAGVAAATARVDHVANMFAELADYRALELLRTHRQRADYLLTTQVRERGFS
jgi:hypothetical protein